MRNYAVPAVAEASAPSNKVEGDYCDDARK
jgi:hypothetical protein